METTYKIPKDFTINEVAKFRDELYALIDKEPVKLVIDFSQCSFIDSTGLGAIVSVFKRLNEHKGDLILKNMNPQVKDLFHMTRLDHVMTIE